MQAAHALFGLPLPSGAAQGVILLRLHSKEVVQAALQQEPSGRARGSFSGRCEAHVGLNDDVSLDHRANLHP